MKKKDKSKFLATKYEVLADMLREISEFKIEETRADGAIVLNVAATLSAIRQKAKMSLEFVSRLTIEAVEQTEKEALATLTRKAQKNNRPI